ncbi:MAG: hypothetical protein IKQ77_05335 [Prevotella sp.]|nr:hypothetical protein [Prevotella sp.]
MKSYIIPLTEVHELETSPILQMTLYDEVGTGGQLSNTDVFDEEDDRQAKSKDLWDSFN